MTLSADDVRAALRDCYDPHLPCNLVDLGSIASVTVSADSDAPGAGIPGVPPRFRVHILLRPPSPDDEAALQQISAQVQNRLAGLETVSAVHLVVDTAQPWSPAQITPAGRRSLGLDGNRALVQIR